MARNIMLIIPEAETEGGLKIRYLKFLWRVGRQLHMQTGANSEGAPFSSSRLDSKSGFGPRVNLQPPGAYIQFRP